ncbi:hypothetical protein ABPG74_004907 [Tetrahymena malaccensis]
MSQTEKKKLGFRDKLKKMLDGDSPREKKKSIIEETSVKFSVTGGSVHSELIMAEAILDSKNDNNNGMPLPIICKWYNKTKSDQITEIEGITGAFYQPNADDINTYIIVEAKPILEESEYKGEPLRQEIGPIVIDKAIQEEVQELLETGRFKIAAKLESIYDPSLSHDENEKRNDSYSFPKQVQLQIDTEKVSIYAQDDERINSTVSLGQFYPSIKIVKRTNNIFELYFSQNIVYRLQAQSNTHRDVITVALRMFCGKKLISSQYSSSEAEEQQEQYQEESNNFIGQQVNSQENQDQMREEQTELPKAELVQQNSGNQQASNNQQVQQQNQQQIHPQTEVRAVRKHQTQASTSESYEVFVKLNELTKKTVDLEQLRDEMKNQIQQLQDENKKKETKLEQVDLQLQELQEKLKVQVEINEQYKQKHSQYMNEKLFLTQELQVIQQEIEGKNREIDDQKVQIEKLNTQLLRKKEILDEEGAQSLQQTIQDLADKLNKQIQQNKVIQEELNEKESKFNETNQEKENLQNEVMHFKKKYEYLLQEKQLQVASQKSLDSPNTSKIQNISSHHSINFNKKEDDNNSEKADVDTQNNLSGHNHMSQSTNNSNQFSKSLQGLSPMHLQKSQSQVTPIQQNKSLIILNGNGIKKNEQVQDIQLIKQQLQTKIEENNGLCKKILQLETTLETITQAYTQDVKSINSPTKRKIKEGGNEQILQKLVNSLTEMITEKDLALENQKKINKELIQKIQELSVSQS